MASVYFFLIPEGAGGGAIEFHLQGVGRQGMEYSLQKTVVEESGWVDFLFEPVPASHGYIYHFYVISLEQRNEPLLVALASEDPYKEGEAYGRGIPEESDLRFETLYSNTIYEKLDDIVAGKPGIFGNKLFLIAVLTTYILMMTVFVYHICPYFFHKR